MWGQRSRAGSAWRGQWPWLQGQELCPSPLNQAEGMERVTLCHRDFAHCSDLRRHSEQSPGGRELGSDCSWRTCSCSGGQGEREEASAPQKVCVTGWVGTLLGTVPHGRATWSL